MGPSISWCLNAGFWLGYSLWLSGFSAFSCSSSSFDDDDDDALEVEKNLAFSCGIG